jgi:hypothetical protein
VLSKARQDPARPPRTNAVGGQGTHTCPASASTLTISRSRSSQRAMKLRPWATLSLTASAACCAVSRYVLMCSAVLSVSCDEAARASGVLQWRGGIVRGGDAHRLKRVVGRAHKYRCISGDDPGATLDRSERG